VNALKQRGFVISDFYNTTRPSFRVGCIGCVTPADMRRFVLSAASSLDQMGVRSRSPKTVSLA
jgi:2-aminoethylphosphonate-pyruvate transaminase